MGVRLGEARREVEPGMLSGGRSMEGEVTIGGRSARRVMVGDGGLTSTKVEVPSSSSASFGLGEAEAEASFSAEAEAEAGGEARPALRRKTALCPSFSPSRSCCKSLPFSFANSANVGFLSSSSLLTGETIFGEGAS